MTKNTERDSDPADINELIRTLITKIAKLFEQRTGGVFTYQQVRFPTDWRMMERAILRGLVDGMREDDHHDLLETASLLARILSEDQSSLSPLGVSVLEDLCQECCLDIKEMRAKGLDSETELAESNPKKLQ
ncbi:hypothetical protein KAM448_36760 [Aeromonas caviae]|uniref:Uncharacterized protein n=1 Tax=Aeromonas caviae TaxID=648 RepID=A0ABD0B8A5_AERCA|nr:MULTISPECIES: hypothetical protein [Aeromonas]BCK65867.1 hypothetical protein KAM330_48560 [Aeromonas hydrophila]BCR31458.1 hypothetical protein KAM376_44640 [Aeromonas caviae]GJA71878.1 hypothetical protein KAM353_15250 [Aeromonas caviae]GJA81653.1 hypothetical protein KAM355_22130 [Aeromonas caviae]GJB00145.1 hypothetical protein KAM359_35520 [Aeromonas caviae]